jgi:hypothetical protein
LSTEETYWRKKNIPPEELTDGLHDGFRKLLISARSLTYVCMAVDGYLTMLTQPRFTDVPDYESLWESFDETPSEGLSTERAECS